MKPMSVSRRDSERRFICYRKGVTVYVQGWVLGSNFAGLIGRSEIVG